MDKNANIARFLRRSFFILFLLISLSLFTLWVISPHESYYFLYMSLLILCNSVFILSLEKIGVHSIKYLIAIILSLLIVLEISCTIFVYKYTGKLPWAFIEKYVGSFQFHPLLAGLPTPNYSYITGDGRIFSHNSQGFRGEEITGWFDANKRIVAIGGSTTYDIGVSNNETWTYKLEKFIGENIKVLNMGVPGQSSAEHVVMTSLIAPYYKPDIILYYMGFNDLRNSHLSHLKTDYSDFHLLRQYGALGIVSIPFGIFATPFLTKYLLSKYFDTIRIVYDRTKPAKGIVSGKIDNRLLQIYERNIKTLIALSKSIGATPVFIPQVINNKAFIRGRNIDSWIPFIPVNDVPSINDAFNSKLVEMANDNGAYVIDDVLKMNCNEGYFGGKRDKDGDYVHFSSQGTTKFSEIITKQLKEKNLIE